MDRDWHPLVLAAAADGGAHQDAQDDAQGEARADQGDDQTSEPISEQTQPKPRRRRRTQAKRGSAGNWRIRGTVLRQRVAQWFNWTRTQRLHMSLRELVAAAHDDGVSLSVPAIQRIEGLVDPQLASERNWIALDYILWLAAYSGQSLADLDRFLTSGDWRHVGNLSDTAPSEESLGDRMRVRFLTLSPERQRAVIDFLEHERYLDELDLQATLGLRGAPRTTPRGTQPQSAPQPSESGFDPATQQVLDDLARGQEEIREALRRHDEQQQQRPGQPGRRRKSGDAGAQGGATDRTDDQRRPG